LGIDDSLVFVIVSLSIHACWELVKNPFVGLLDGIIIASVANRKTSNIDRNLKSQTVLKWR
jgi:hypothetical protein